MNKSPAPHQSKINIGNLRQRAEKRLSETLSAQEALPQHDLKQKLYELQVNQVEVELLNEEFNRLRQKISAKYLSPQERDTFGHSYLFLNSEGRICDEKVTSSRPANARRRGWIGSSLSDYVHPGKRALLENFLRNVFASNSKISCELAFNIPADKKHQGLKLPQFALIEAVADDQKQYCLAVIEDISAQKAAEERDKSANAALSMLEQTIEASRNEIFMFDASTRHFTFANRRALENLGYTMDELKWLMPSDIQNHVFNEEMDDLLAYLLSHKQSVRKFNAVHLRKNGSLYPVEIHLQLFEQETESVFIAIVLDISSQTKIESQLKSIVESVDAIIFATNDDLKLVFMSDQVLEILGYSASQFIGSSMTELIDSGFFHESDRAMLTDGFNQVVKNGRKVSDLRFRAKHADGTWRWFNMNITPNRSVDGYVGQVVGVMHDMQAQHQAEEALHQLNQKLDSRVQEEIQKNKEKDLLLQRQSRLAGMGEMIGNIAHQWRQPINSLGLILSDLEDAALYEECDLTYIQTAVGKSKKIIQKMSSTIDDFRNFFREDKSLGVFSLKQVTDECINLVEAAMKSSNINIVIRCEHDVRVSGYANEYSQALMNILSNARDAIVDRKMTDGEIVIEIGEKGDFGVHSVTDNGGGIPASLLQKIFEPHFTTKAHGIGIGLYMTLVSIEKNMHGRITVKNVADGAKFSMYLPKDRIGDERVIH